VDEYGTSDGYGGLAGFGGPALEAANAPVVRYQDLHRSHAPASAGAPAVGYGDVMSTPETGVYGDVAVANGPVVEQVPGYGMAATRPLYSSAYGASGASAPAAPGSSAAPATKAAAPEEPEEKGVSWWQRAAAAGSKAVQETGKGLIRGTAKQVGVSRFEESGMASKPVMDDVKKGDERPEWQTYAIWGGATVVGVGVAYLLYRAYSKSEKGAS
jgi:hypothetical protein